ncbi:hypothetical protein BDK51DRAFT_35026 [Blyttiomyces helicus]|uniref:Uncharacterized protein n=1 Tax=Blyttiomyces helicus TaxID=388810 RepID=A0A4P9W2R7_9FUNG|nr:hypothetical protein BDK51DRAFT_35026 [Blyttiomyces helicus]|eukprot:RKO84900.1 hypothetical protein BDK51DRAFT_35026 [Blyttiomyces helicus]
MFEDMVPNNAGAEVTTMVANTSKTASGQALFAADDDFDAPGVYPATKGNWGGTLRQGRIGAMLKAFADVTTDGGTAEGAGGVSAKVDEGTPSPAGYPATAAGGGWNDPRREQKQSDAGTTRRRTRAGSEGATDEGGGGGLQGEQTKSALESELPGVDRDGSAKNAEAQADPSVGSVISDMKSTARRRSATVGALAGLPQQPTLPRSTPASEQAAKVDNTVDPIREESTEKIEISATISTGHTGRKTLKIVRKSSRAASTSPPSMRDVGLWTSSTRNPAQKEICASGLPPPSTTSSPLPSQDEDPPSPQLRPTDARVTRSASISYAPVAPKLSLVTSSSPTRPAGITTRPTTRSATVSAGSPSRPTPELVVRRVSGVDSAKLPSSNAGNAR